MILQVVRPSRRWCSARIAETGMRAGIFSGIISVRVDNSNSKYFILGKKNSKIFGFFFTSKMKCGRRFSIRESCS